jgi:type VI secretion system protein ImpL
VAAAYLYTGPEIVQRALFWTAIGLLAVLLFIIGSRVFGWWRLRRAKAAAKPAPPPPAAAPVHPDDQALIALLAEANSALSKAPSFAGRRRSKPLSALPLYLLAGAEGSGKTSTFLAAGLEPQLLAGQGTTPVAPTRLANIWFAKNAIFVEMGGRTFAGDLARWNQLLRVLRSQSTLKFWQRIWGGVEQPMDLRGVIAFCDAKEFTGASSDPQRLEHSVRDWQDRLRAVAEVFAVEFPVYLALTKCDKIPFFPDFFRRLSESEVNQVFGCTLPVGDTERPTSEVLADAEAKRLTASFRPLYHALAERRLTYLAREPNPAQRMGMYEFPRELKRIRSPLVQFLTDVFRPNALGPGPVLRGYYLTGVRETEIVRNDPVVAQTDFDTPASLEATKLFRADATQLFQPGNVPMGGGHGRFGLRSLFVADLFHRVVLPDRLARQVRPVDHSLERRRLLAFGSVCAVCILLCGGFGWSWANNHSLVTDIQASLDRAPVHRIPPSQADLETLEQLRLEIVRLEGSLPWLYHWGLYTGNRVLPEARAAWFRRFQRVLLIDWNAAMVSYLNALPAAPDADVPSDPVYQVLKTHLIITSGSCSVDSALVSRVLKEYRAQTAPNMGTEWQALADRQIDFYARELAYGTPPRLPEDAEARDHARQYLQKIKGIDRLYAKILVDAQSHVPKLSNLRDMAPNYAQVLSGPEGANAVFSREGWTYFEKASKEQNAEGLGEACVIGETRGVVGAWQQNTETARILQRKYIAEYIESWKKFVEGFAVLRYNGPEDAARKLEILSDHKSPLLAVFALTANRTNFPSAEASAAANVLTKSVDKIFRPLKKAEEQTKTAIPPPVETGGAPSTPADITRFFQPVDWVVPPGSETWVVEKNAAYVEALSQLRRSMQDIAQASGSPDPAIYQMAGQNYEKALDTVSQIAKGFRPVGVGGLDTTVETLLKEPIQLTSSYIKVPNPATGVNAALHNFCSSERSTLRKYPFQSSSAQDVKDISLPELAAFLQPMTGAIWKFQQQSLAEFVVKEGGQWKTKDPAKKPQVTQELLNFLNQAQAAADAFYPGGITQPQLSYTLRPNLTAKDTILELEIDGKPYAWTTGLRHQFVWPSAAGVQNPGAVARLKGSVTYPFASEPGIWGIFKILGDAEPRDVGSKLVEWKYSRGLRGRAELIEPPVQVEIVSFPNNVDVFNPKFWAELQCPSSAVQ